MASLLRSCSTFTKHHVCLIDCRDFTYWKCPDVYADLLAFFCFSYSKSCARFSGMLKQHLVEFTCIIKTSLSYKTLNNLSELNRLDSISIHKNPSTKVIQILFSQTSLNLLKVHIQTTDESSQYTFYTIHSLKY